MIGCILSVGSGGGPAPPSSDNLGPKKNCPIRQKICRCRFPEDFLRVIYSDAIHLAQVEHYVSSQGDSIAEDVVTSVLEGLLGFAVAWEGIATELLATKKKWDFSKAPKGGAAKLTSIEFGGLFVTVANRAIQNEGLFERKPTNDLTRDVRSAPLRPGEHW